MTRSYRSPAQGRTVNDTHPPLDLLPPDLVKLIEEKQRLQRAYDDAGNEDNRLNGVHRGDSLDVEAAKTDAAASAAAARSGKPKMVTAARDALAAQRDEIKRTRESLGEALAAVTAEISQARWRWEDAGESADRAAEARARVAETSAALLQALGEASVAIAVDDWVKGEFYDSELRFRLLDVMPSLTNLIGGRGGADSDMYPVDVTEILANVANI